MVAAIKNEETNTELKSALDGLTYQSESDYPLEFVCWEKPSGKALDGKFVREQLGLGSDANVEEADAQSFLEGCSKVETWFGDDEKESAQGFQKLQKLLNDKAKNLKLFRAGEIEVTILVVGEDENNIVGFKTTSIET